MANKNPSPETRFGAENGNPRNPGGKTKEQKRLEMEAAEMSVRIRHSMLSTIADKVTNATISKEDLAELLNPATLKLFKDSEDRAHGTPTQSINHESPEGTMTPITKIERVIMKPDGD